MFEPMSARSFFNARSSNVSFIDTKTSTVVAMFLSAATRSSRSIGKGVYDNIESSNSIVEIDAAKGTVTKEYSIAPCMGPSGLAIDTKNRKLFSVCSNRMMAISDPDTGKVVTTIPIGAGPDAAAFDPGTGLIFSSTEAMAP
jgi:DNA-binding beta-propeller fold protein YncE